MERMARKKMMNSLKNAMRKKLWTNTTTTSLRHSSNPNYLRSYRTNWRRVSIGPRWMRLARPILMRKNKKRGKPMGRRMKM